MPEPKEVEVKIEPTSDEYELALEERSRKAVEKALAERHQRLLKIPPKELARQFGAVEAERE